MLILVGILPTMYALKTESSSAELVALNQGLHAAATYAAAHEAGYSNGAIDKDPGPVVTAFLRKSGTTSPDLYHALNLVATQSATLLNGVDSIGKIPAAQRGALRSNLYLLSTAESKLAKNHQLDSAEAEKAAKNLGKTISAVTNFIPIWVKIAVAMALGLGTMIGWKRIVVTVGEKIGKSHLTYAQGASAELVAMLTISLADVLGLPVSTTHVLSSGIAGTMAANGSGLQMATVRNIILAWVLTLPVCVLLGSTLFALGLNLVAHLGIH
jgi:PiT family inorganic phosphate transporter